MKFFTNRHAGMVLLILSASLMGYVVLSDWAFVEMRDGMRIGGFPIAFLALCILFSGLILLDREEGAALLPDMAELTLAGLAKIIAFILGGLVLAFYHERIGFAALCIPFLVMTSLFMGQRGGRAMALYAVGICVALFGILRALDFDLNLLPAGMGI